jgi:hypothetical protein
MNTYDPESLAKHDGKNSATAYVAIRADYTSSGADVNGDNKIGLAEVIFILQKVAGMR